MTTTTRRRRSALAAVPLGLVLLAGCGSSSDDNGIATAGGGSPTPAATGTPAPDASDAALQFARCLRKHGIDVPDPDPNNGGLAALSQDLRNAPAGKRNAALKACQQYLGGGSTADPQQRAQLTQKYVDCLRRHGEDIGDPDPDTGELPKDDQQKFLHPDATMQKAMAACQDARPGAGGNQ
jgi:hypothetical protein